VEASRVKILIVEDDVDSGEALMHLLADFGHEVRLVTKPALAAAVACQFLPQVAILDIGLPMISGYELLAVLRVLPELEGCKFFAVTAHAGAGMLERSLAAGFDHHLTKPLPVPHLLRCLQGIA
jgi:CheY-like chemotaxis protein